MSFSTPIGSAGTIHVRLTRQHGGQLTVTIDTHSTMTCLTGPSADAVAALIRQARETCDRLNREEAASGKTGDFAP